MTRPPDDTGPTPDGRLAGHDDPADPTFDERDLGRDDWASGRPDDAIPGRGDAAGAAGDRADPVGGRDERAGVTRGGSASGRPGRGDGATARTDAGDESPVRFGRRRGLRLVVTVTLVVVVAAAVRGAGLGQGDDGDGSAGERGAGSSATTAASTATSAGAATSGTPPPTNATTSSSVAPPDVEDPRQAIDLATPPVATDPIEVARWWAATFVAYSPAEPAADLVARLDPYTTATLRQSLLAVPPAASYDLPLEIAGASAQPDPATAATARPLFTISVETPGALVVYRLAVVQGAGGWQVDEANRI